MLPVKNFCSAIYLGSIPDEPIGTTPDSITGKEDPVMWVILRLQLSLLIP